MHQSTPLTFGIIAGTVLLAALFLGIYFSIHQASDFTLTPAVNTASSTTPVQDYYHDITAWEIDREQSAGFMISYPIDFDVQTGSSTEPWRVYSNGISGTRMFTLTVPKAYLPQSNFSGATLTVGVGAADHTASCLSPDSSGDQSTTMRTETIGGVPFTVYTSSDAGAGNIYETTSYRAVHEKRCFVIEYTIHSTQLANYPVTYGLHEFDRTKITDLLSRIVGTFAFLQ